MAILKKGKIFPVGNGKLKILLKASRQGFLEMASGISKIVLSVEYGICFKILKACLPLPCRHGLRV